jgi:hypothetical protein
MNCAGATHGCDSGEIFNRAQTRNNTRLSDGPNDKFASRRVSVTVDARSPSDENSRACGMDHKRAILT